MFWKQDSIEDFISFKLANQGSSEQAARVYNLQLVYDNKLSAELQQLHKLKSTLYYYQVDLQNLRGENKETLFQEKMEQMNQLCQEYKLEVQQQRKSIKDIGVQRKFNINTRKEQLDALTQAIQAETSSTQAKIEELILSKQQIQRKIERCKLQVEELEPIITNFQSKYDGINEAKKNLYSLRSREEEARINNKQQQDQELELLNRYQQSIEKAKNKKLTLNEATSNKINEALKEVTYKLEAIYPSKPQPQNLDTESKIRMLGEQMVQHRQLISEKQEQYAETIAGLQKSIKEKYGDTLQTMEAIEKEIGDLKINQFNCEAFTDQSLQPTQEQLQQQQNEINEIEKRLCELQVEENDCDSQIVTFDEQLGRVSLQIQAKK